MFISDLHSSPVIGCGRELKQSEWVWRGAEGTVAEECGEVWR